jgi:alkylation response protein AidB-like acyl-CoA dehydrogenase
MDVRYSAEQEALRESVVQVVERLGPRSVQDLDDAERRAKLDAAVEASGWRDLRAPAEAGGPLASAVEVAIVAEELARGLADAAFVGPTLAAELRRCAGVAPARSSETIALVPDLSELAGGVGGGIGDGAIGGGVAPHGVAVDAHGCVSALVLVSREGAHGVASVPLASPIPLVDLTRRSARVRPGDVGTDVDPGTLDETDLVRWSAFALTVTSADLVGAMRGAVDLATEYAKGRRQYGVAIGSFQAVQHLLADALVSMEGSRSAALHAAWAVDALSPDEARTAAAVAKAYCARAARGVCEAAIQVHGGIGNTWDCLAHVYLRRSLLSIDLLGGVGPSLSLVLRSRGIGGDRGLR